MELSWSLAVQKILAIVYIIMISLWRRLVFRCVIHHFVLPSHCARLVSCSVSEFPEFVRRGFLGWLGNAEREKGMSTAVSFAPSL